MKSRARYRLLVLAVVISGVIAGTVGNAFAGANEWSRYGSSPSIDAQFVALSPGFAVDNTVFIGGTGDRGGDSRSNDGVMKSVDSGLTWVQIGAAQGVRDVTALALAPDYTSSGIILVGVETWPAGLLRSADGGATWARMDAGAFNEVLDIQFSPAFATDRTAFISIHASGEGSSVLITHDGGVTWQPAASPPEAGGLMAVSPRFADDRTLLMVTSRGSRGYSGVSLVRSVDGGSTWAEVRGSGLPEGLYDVGISPTGGGGQYLFAAARSSDTQAGLYRSADAGATWTRVLAVDRLDAWMWCGSRFVFSPNWAVDKTMFIVIDGQLFKSANEGASFYQVGVMWLKTDTFAQLDQALAVPPDFASRPVVFSNSRGNDEDVWTYTFSSPVKARLSKPIVETAVGNKGRVILITGLLRPIHVGRSPRFEYRLYRKRGTRYVKYKFYARPTSRGGGIYSNERLIYWNSLPRGRYKVVTYHADSGEAGHLPSRSRPTYFTRGSRFSFWKKR